MTVANLRVVGYRPQFRLRGNAMSRRPSRSADHAAEVAALEAGVLIGKNVGLDVAERRIRLVLDAVVEGLDDLLLKVIAARMRFDH